MSAESQDVWRTLELVPDGLIVAGVDGVIRTANQAILDMLGAVREDIVGHPLRAIIPERFQSRHNEAFARWADGAPLSFGSEPVNLVALRADMTEVPVAISFREVDQNGDRSIIAFLRPTAATSPRSGLALRLLEVVGRGLPLHGLLTAILRELTTGLGWDVGLVWLDQHADGAVNLGATWPEAEAAEASYAGAASNWSFAHGESLVGSVFAGGAVTWVEDLRAEALFDRNEVAERYGLRSALFFPLLSDNRCVGVVELVGHEQRGIDISTHEVVEVLSAELGALLVHRFDAERAEAERHRLDLAVEASEIGIWTWHLQSNRIECSAQLAGLHGREANPYVETFDSFVERVTEEHRTDVSERLLQAARDGQRFEFVYEISCSEKRTAWLRGAGQGLVDADGELQSITGVAFDITDSVEFASAQETQLRHATLVGAIGKILTSGWLDAAILQECAESIADAIDAAFVRIWTLEEDSDELVLEASAGMYTHLDGDHARVPVGSFKIGRIARNRRPHLSNSLEDDPEISDPQWAAREGMAAFAGYPLLIGGRCFGVLAMFARHELDGQTIRVLGTITDMISLARARHDAYAERAQVAEVLQRSLLPPQLPAITGVELSSSYLPSIGDLSGDFYDVFPLRGDDWGIVVGDVRGKGPTAASATSLARHTLRTASMLRPGTDEPLRALNAAMLRPFGDTCTAIFARLRVEASGVSVMMSRAGHPAPVIRRADGSIESPTGGGPMIGVFASVSFDERAVILAPGDAMVLFTDGVTEARRQGDFFGEERLARLVCDAGDVSAQALADSVLGAAVAFHDAVHIDDIAVLVVKALPYEGDIVGAGSDLQP